MPELPEVEVVRVALARDLIGRRVRHPIVREPRLRWPVPVGLTDAISGRTVESVERRGKYLLIGFSHGTLIAHLGMSGNFRLVPADCPPGPHDHVDLVLDHAVLRFSDPRRFGALLWHAGIDGDVNAHPRLSVLGPEPFSAGFDGRKLHAATRGRRQSIKQLLLGGHAVVGVGNIYASESLHAAGIRPTTPAGRLSLGRCERLAAAIRSTLAAAIAQGGTTLRDFAGPSGAGGYFQLSCKVYGRAGEACGRCGGTVRRSVEGQRATYWCAGCQY